MEKSKVPLINPNIVFRIEDDGYGFAFDTRTEDLMTLNTTGSEIWNLIDGSRDIETIINLLSQDFSIEPSEITESVTRFFNSLYESNWISIKD